jgi:hypothetical protein
MQHATLLTAFSMLAASCASVPRPNSDHCTVNVPALHQTCWNLSDDYTDDGRLKPGAVPHFKPCPSDKWPCRDPATKYKDEAAMLADLNKGTYFDLDSWAEIKAWVKELRDAGGRRGD